MRLGLAVRRNHFEGGGGNRRSLVWRPYPAGKSSCRADRPAPPPTPKRQAPLRRGDEAARRTNGNRRRETRGRGRPDHSPARRPWEHRPRGRGEGLGRSARYLRDEAHRSQQGLRCGWRLHQPGRKAISPGSAAPKSASITILPDHILANMPAKWRGAKTCAARQPARGWMSAAAWPLPIRRQGHGQDIGSAISGKRSFVKPPDRRSARGCHGLCHQMRASRAF